MAQNLYGPRIWMGNWNEDLYLEEMQLSISEDGYIHYGDSMLLVNLDHPDRDTDLFLGGDLSLCMTPDNITAHLSDEVEVPCGLSTAQTNITIGRNTYHFECRWKCHWSSSSIWAELLPWDTREICRQNDKCKNCQQLPPNESRTGSPPASFLKYLFWKGSGCC
ncbi:cilia- and flagella-associated protein 161-like [Tamandua tetradactyla]|uniref:cilia- and flagella-associated protein 161-like n=1 Tax=Tamandua tetradactyla TaxID=48850 RepID=UPI004053CA70